MIITSASNDKVKEIKKLIKSASDRREKGVYIVEGIRMFREIPDGDILEVYVSEAAYEKNRSLILGKMCEEKLIQVSDKVFNSMSDTSTPQGIMAVVKTRKVTLDDTLKGDTPFLLIVETLQDPGNLGTIVRTAEGAGVTGIVISRDSVDLYNPKTIRSTMGSVFRVPVYVSEDLGKDIDKIKSKGVTIYGAHLEGREFYSKDLTKPCAFLIGNEGKGLSREISSRSDELIKIPMCGRVESLNAAVSASVIAYEVLRQRRFS